MTRGRAREVAEALCASRWRGRMARAAIGCNLGAAFACIFAGSAALAQSNGQPLLPLKAPPANSAPYDWTGFYLGGNLGYAWGNSIWSTSGAAGSMSIAQPIDQFNEAGSFYLGLQGGYDYMLPNRWVMGVEADLSTPSFQNLAGISVGGINTLNSPFGPETYSETVLDSGTVRGRIGYAAGNWLFYATGGFAWSYNQLSLTNSVTGATDMPFLWRLGWAAGGGIETPIAPHWTARVEYLYTDYGSGTVLFANNGQNSTSDWKQSELRVGLDYQFDDDASATNGTAPMSAMALKTSASPDLDNLSLHGQDTFVWQGYPPMRSPYAGPQSLPGSGEGRETDDLTLYAGVKLWTGAELWVNPEIDQGFGLDDTHGAAGFPSAESYKLGFAYPYGRVQRAFIRQTIDLGGDTEKVDDDVNQFAGSQTANRLVLTVGKFFLVDIFDTNKYANNSKIDFLNWSVVNAGTFDFASDAWSVTDGAAAEWYQGNWTLRGAVVDATPEPAESADSASAYGLEPSFNNFEMVGELENRYQLWGEPGTIKVTGFLIRGTMASFQTALDLSAATGLDINDATAASRIYQTRPGVSVNWAQQVTETVGLFARAGWADGNVEPWNNTDIDRSVQAGASFNGKPWGRPDDTIGVAGVINAISAVHEAWLNAGGLGIVVGDGQLPNPGLEQILETYYSYAVSPSTRVSFDYQFIANPAYNNDRGPANVFAGRFHWQF